MLRDITEAYWKKTLKIDKLLEDAKNEIKEIFRKRKRKHMRTEYHDRRIDGTFSKLKHDLEKTFREFDEKKSIEKKFLDTYLEIANKIIQKDPLSYYNIVWTFGFIMRVLNFNKSEIYVLSILYKFFKSLSEKIDRETSDLIKKDIPICSVFA